MIYVCYDPSTGKIKETGITEPEYTYLVESRGYPVIFLDQWIDYRTHRVNVETKQIEHISEEVTSK